ncbi:hypothetical protein [Methylobacter sp. YRD-M1]|uniref:hypothetical protein n=1 Tax=Methylobacter sp. YRD-M1 TaxID=2911520 RepID=UPI00227D1528|nr:hypothetical protein [Methylobacter sp. YRD-M1]WAK04249.1 hypothetical protein LZ558_15660 [Methylobacter sp. YRD-M1]
MADQQAAEAVPDDSLHPADRAEKALTMVNVWAIDKDIALKLLLLELVRLHGENTLAMKTLEPNPQAIELCRAGEPDVSAYVYTFAQNHGRYGIDLKYPISAHNIVGENENLSLDRTLEIIAIHLFS